MNPEIFGDDEDSGDQDPCDQNQNDKQRSKDVHGFTTEKKKRFFKGDALNGKIANKKGRWSPKFHCAASYFIFT